MIIQFVAYNLPLLNTLVLSVVYAILSYAETRTERGLNELSGKNVLTEAECHVLSQMEDVVILRHDVSMAIKGSFVIATVFSLGLIYFMDYIQFFLGIALYVIALFCFSIELYRFCLSFRQASFLLDLLYYDNKYLQDVRLIRSCFLRICLLMKFMVSVEILLIFIHTYKYIML